MILVWMFERTKVENLRSDSRKTKHKSWLCKNIRSNFFRIISDLILHYMKWDGKRMIKTELFTAGCFTLSNIKLNSF